MAGTPGGAAEPAPFAQVDGGTVTGPEQHANTVRLAEFEAKANYAETGGTLVMYSDLRWLVALAERADTLKRERDEANAIADQRYRFLLQAENELRDLQEPNAGTYWDMWRRSEAALEAADALAISYGNQFAKDAKFYAYQDARAALAGPQTKEQT